MIVNGKSLLYEDWYGIAYFLTVMGIWTRYFASTWALDMSIGIAYVRQNE